jgi:hypothetical protein
MIYYNVRIKAMNDDMDISLDEYGFDKETRWEDLTEKEKSDVKSKIIEETDIYVTLEALE